MISEFWQNSAAKAKFYAQFWFRDKRRCRNWCLETRVGVANDGCIKYNFAVISELWQNSAGKPKLEVKFRFRDKGRCRQRCLYETKYCSDVRILLRKQNTKQNFDMERRGGVDNDVCMKQNFAVISEFWQILLGKENSKQHSHSETSGGVDNDVCMKQNSVTISEFRRNYAEKANF